MTILTRPTWAGRENFYGDAIHSKKHNWQSRVPLVRCETTSGRSVYLQFKNLTTMTTGFRYNYDGDDYNNSTFSQVFYRIAGAPPIWNNSNWNPETGAGL